ncbi:hypothetical protein HDU76_007479 [Blyttiomyces sp. JEL0837]|nr:hypothetical protein HDU76_007479 [Blyttiomyces sp. JEL0837]
MAPSSTTTDHVTTTTSTINDHLQRSSKKKMKKSSSTKKKSTPFSSHKFIASASSSSSSKKRESKKNKKSKVKAASSSKSSCPQAFDDEELPMQTNSSAAMPATVPETRFFDDYCGDDDGMVIERNEDYGHDLDQIDPGLGSLMDVVMDIASTWRQHVPSNNPQANDIGGEDDDLGDPYNNYHSYTPPMIESTPQDTTPRVDDDEFFDDLKSGLHNNFDDYDYEYDDQGYKLKEARDEDSFVQRQEVDSANDKPYRPIRDDVILNPETLASECDMDYPDGLTDVNIGGLFDIINHQPDVGFETRGDMAMEEADEGIEDHESKRVQEPFEFPGNIDLTLNLTFKRRETSPQRHGSPQQPTQPITFNLETRNSSRRTKHYDTVEETRTSDAVTTQDTLESNRDYIEYVHMSLKRKLDDVEAFVVRKVRVSEENIRKDLMSRGRERSVVWNVASAAVGAALGVITVLAFT